MRILLITHYYAPEIGAPQRRWDAFVKNWQRSGHEVTVVTSLPHYPLPSRTRRIRQAYRPFRRSAGEHGETVIRLPFLPHGYDLVTRTLDHLFVAGLTLVAGLLLAGRRFDAVITTVPALPSLFAGYIISRLFRTPLVVEMRDAWPDLVTFTGSCETSPGWVARLRAWAHRAVTNTQLKSEHLVTTTHDFAEVLQARGAQHISVIRNGVDLESVPDATTEALSCRERAGGSAERSVLHILYLGTLGRSQGLGAVIDAAGMAAAGGADLRLRFVGDGANRAWLQRRAERSQAQIEFFEAVLPGEVAQHYAWADTVVVSLRDWEPFEWTVPSKVYELLATNRHVSALVAGEAAEIVQEAGAGFVVAPGDSQALARHWMQLAEDPQLLDHGHAGRDWARENVDYQKLSRRYLDLIRTLARGEVFSDGGLA